MVEVAHEGDCEVHRAVRKLQFEFTDADVPFIEKTFLADDEYLLGDDRIIAWGRSIRRPNQAATDCEEEADAAIEPAPIEVEPVRVEAMETESTEVEASQPAPNEVGPVEVEPEYRSQEEGPEVSASNPGARLEFLLQNLTEQLGAFSTKIDSIEGRIESKMDVLGARLSALENREPAQVAEAAKPPPPATPPPAPSVAPPPAPSQVPPQSVTPPAPASSPKPVSTPGNVAASSDIYAAVVALADHVETLTLRCMELSGADSRRGVHGDPGGGRTRASTEQELLRRELEELRATLKEEQKRPPSLFERIGGVEGIEGFILGLDNAFKAGAFTAS